MASRPFSALRNERSALDLPVAALAGLAVAFAAFAIPGDLLAELIGASGLPNLLAAAQPPLGMTARIALAAGGSLTVFGAAFLLLRWLDRFAVSPARPTEVGEQKPRLRKRDAHPDAPARVPLSAIRELGEPAPPLSVQRKADPVAPAIPAVEPTPPPVVESVKPETLSELMARLERGLERRTAPKSASAKPVLAPDDAAQAFPSASDDRLQSAIDSLQRLTARDL